MPTSENPISLHLPNPRSERGSYPLSDSFSAQLAIYGTRYFHVQRTVVCWKANSEVFARGLPLQHHSRVGAETKLRLFCVFGLASNHGTAPIPHAAYSFRTPQFVVSSLCLRIPCQAYGDYRECYCAASRIHNLEKAPTSTKLGE
jgi:hypothetical protein